MKKIEVKATLPTVNVPLTASEETALTEGVVMSRNMRPSDGNVDRLVPVDDFGVMATGLESAALLGVLDHSVYGTAAVLADGMTIKVVTGIGDSSALPFTETLPALGHKPLCFLHDRDGAGIVMTEGGPCRLEWTANGFDLYDLTATPPEASITVATELPVTVGVASAVLRDDYNRETTELSQSDSRALARAMAKAYCTIVDKTSHAGYRVEPFLVRYRYVDASGCDVYSSPVKLMLPSSGLTLIEEQRCGLSEGRRSAFNITVQAYKAVARMPEADEEWSGRVAALIVDATPCLPLVNTSLLSVENRMAVESGILRCYMPGASVDMSSDTQCVGRRLELMLTHFDELATEIVRIDNPFGTNAGREVPLMAHIAGEEVSARTVGVLRQLAKIEKTRITKRRQRSNRLLKRVTLPHRFAAANGTLNGATALWGDIIELPWRGWSTGEWALATEAGTSWLACVVVEMADGKERAVWSGQGPTHAPVTITPLLYYPSEEAVAVEIRVVTSSGVALHRIPLEAVPGTGIAVARDYRLEPVRLDFRNGPAFTVPPHTMKPSRHPGMVVSTPADEVVAPASVVEEEATVIHALTPATATTSAWDYSRNRFYLFGNGGITMAIVNAESEISTLQVLSRKGVADRRHVAVDGSASGVVAFAGGDLVRIKGSAVTVLNGIVPADAVALAFDRSDLWIVGKEHWAVVRPAAAEGYHYLRDTPTVSDVASWPGRPLLVINAGGELLDASRRHVAPKEVEWSCRLSFSDVVKPQIRGAMGTFLWLTSIGLRLVCSALKARFVATTDAGSASLSLVRVLLSVLLEGSLKSSLHLPVRIAGSSHLTLTLKGVVSADARLHGLTLCCE